MRKTSIVAAPALFLGTTLAATADEPVGSGVIETRSAHSVAETAERIRADVEAKAVADCDPISRCTRR